CELARPELAYHGLRQCGTDCAFAGLGTDRRPGRNMETLDLALAIFHHLLVFALAAVLAMEATLLRDVLSGNRLVRLARIDRAYGLVALMVVVVGVGRVLFGLKGWEFYVYNASFWA